MENPSLSINLGKKRGETLSSVFLKWIINSGRIIIVVVELLALGALGFRFYIDRQIVDLHDKILQEQLFVKSQTPKETLYRNLQQRLAAIATLSKETQGKIDFLKDLILDLNNSEFSSTNLNVVGNIIAIEGQTSSIFVLNSLIGKIRKNPDVLSISLDDLTSLDQGIRFKITTELKKQKDIL